MSGMEWTGIMDYQRNDLRLISVAPQQRLADGKLVWIEGNGLGLAVPETTEETARHYHLRD